MKKLLFSCAALMLLFLSVSQGQVDVRYQQPPEEILKLADAPTAPSVRINREGDHMVLLYRSRYKTISELSETELRLAGLRINPKTNIGSRERFYNNITLMKVGNKEETSVSGLPDQPRLSNFSWSPDESMMAFTHTTQKGVELWVLDIGRGRCRKLTEDRLNANIGMPYDWFKDNESLLVKFLPDNRQPLIDKSENIPQGPTVSVNKGQKAQNRTYQDLLKDKADEFNFEQLARAELYRVSLEGQKSLWKENAMYRGVSFSPDGEYVMVTTIERPFSYIVPYYRFPSTSVVYDKQGNRVKKILEVPLTEDLPKGFMAVRKGMRSLSWRNDKPATLIFAKALDGGDPEKQVEYRDEVLQWKAPFNNEPMSLLKTINRFSGVMWGDKETAAAMDYWWNTRNTKTYLFNPSDPSQEPRVIFDRNYQDRYNDPGRPVTQKNQYGESVLDIDGKFIYLLGDGYSEEGIRPFVDKYNLKTGETKRLWRADGKNTLERILFALDMKKGNVLSRIESSNEYPNYYIRNVKKNRAPEAITFFENPFKSIMDIHKEVIHYKREDGVDLSATLYLPAGYDREEKEKLPMLMWAYPREYKDKASASQVTSSPNEFTYPHYGSPVFWVTRGYAVLDDAAFPIIGEDEEEPNDTFIPQLVADAKAAIDAVDKLGFIDPNRVAVGGHSYGAFMTANLLSHSNLFAAGIARSGAYNRTLTPFGFQSEQRTYWEAPEIYYEMSPFMHADKMKSPLLLIHGKADNNSGTYPMQSERYFNALKGLGANVRLVMLPRESHGYAARESVLHLLWEQERWLEKFVKKNK